MEVLFLVHFNAQFLRFQNIIVKKFPSFPPQDFLQTTNEAQSVMNPDAPEPHRRPTSETALDSVRGHSGHRQRTRYFQLGISVNRGVTTRQLFVYITSTLTAVNPRVIKCRRQSRSDSPSLVAAFFGSRTVERVLWCSYCSA